MSKLVSLTKDRLVTLCFAYQPDEFDIRQNFDPVARTEMNHGRLMKVGVKRAENVSLSTYRRLEHMHIVGISDRSAQRLIDFDDGRYNRQRFEVVDNLFGSQPRSVHEAWIRHNPLDLLDH